MASPAASLAAAASSVLSPSACSLSAAAGLAIVRRLLPFLGLHGLCRLLRRALLLFLLVVRLASCRLWRLLLRISITLGLPFALALLLGLGLGLAVGRSLLTLGLVLRGRLLVRFGLPRLVRLRLVLRVLWRLRSTLRRALLRLRLCLLLRGLLLRRLLGLLRRLRLIRLHGRRPPPPPAP